MCVLYNIISVTCFHYNAQLYATLNEYILIINRYILQKCEPFTYYDLIYIP